jgi:glycerate 2-kinase
VIEAALAAVDPYAAVHRVLRRQEATLTLNSTPHTTYDLNAYERIVVLGAGKATAPMAQAVEEILGDYLTEGRIVVKYDHALPLQRITCDEAGHPLPDANGLAAGDALLASATALTERDLAICLLSGGGSALLESLPPPLTLADVQATTQCLLESGATIVEMNTLRKHLSRVKGGRLAEAIAPATLITLVLSDVVGSPLPAIASGPTVPDPTRWQAVGDIVQRYDLMEKLPPAVQAYLRAGIAGEIADTPKSLPPAPILIIGDNQRAITAAQIQAEALGYRTYIESTTLEGEAHQIGTMIGQAALRVRASHTPITPPACLIWGGESTVTLGQAYGMGGRNQEVALAAALEIDGETGILIGAVATDGTDGPTDSAGALVDGGTVMRGGGTAAAHHHLQRHDAYPFFVQSGDHLPLGATRTNVNDLLMVLVKR